MATQRCGVPGGKQYHFIRCFSHTNSLACMYKSPQTQLVPETETWVLIHDHEIVCALPLNIHTQIHTRSHTSINTSTHVQRNICALIFSLSFSYAHNLGSTGRTRALACICFITGKQTLASGKCLCLQTYSDVFDQCMHQLFPSFRLSPSR